MGISVQLHILLVFDLNYVEIVGTVDHQRHLQAAECGCPLAQQSVRMSDSGDAEIAGLDIAGLNISGRV